MNSILQKGAALGMWLPLHILALSSVLTGLFMASSAQSLGVLGSVVLFLGIFGMFFGGLIEVLLALRLALRWACVRWQQGRA